MYLGRVVELGLADEVIAEPQHPYTQALLRASLLEDERGKLFSIPGSVAAARELDHGCRFLPRCPVAAQLGITDMCRSAEPELDSCGEHEHHSRCYASREHAEAG
jgi:peptide/nickel transport system ATP-binding protein